MAGPRRVRRGLPQPPLVRALRCEAVPLRPGLQQPTVPQAAQGGYRCPDPCTHWPLAPMISYETCETYDTYDILLQQPKMEQFLTTNGRGWGVAAGELIKKGDFIVEYAGKMLPFVCCVPCGFGYPCCWFVLRYEFVPRVQRHTAVRVRATNCMCTPRGHDSYPYPHSNHMTHPSQYVSPRSSVA